MRFHHVPWTARLCFVALSVLAQRSAAQDLFDCEAGLDNFKDSWSDAKKEWCCKNKNKGCEDASADAASVNAGDAASSDGAADPSDAAAGVATDAAPADGGDAGVAAAAASAGAAAAAASAGAAAAAASFAPPPPPKPPVPPVQPTPPQPAVAPAAPARVLSAAPTTTTTTTQSEAQSKTAASQTAAAAQEKLNSDLHAASGKKNLVDVQSLLTQRADINSIVRGGGILYNLAHSTKADDKEAGNFAKSLIALGANLDWADSRGRTALFLAAVHSKNLDLMDAFKNAKNKNPHRGYGVTALQLVVRDGREDIVQALVEMRANPDHKDSRGGNAKGWVDLHGGGTPKMRALLGMDQTTTTTTTPAPASAARLLGDRLAGDL